MGICLCLNRDVTEDNGPKSHYYTVRKTATSLKSTCDSFKSLMIKQQSEMPTIIRSNHQTNKVCTKSKLTPKTVSQVGCKNTSGLQASVSSNPLYSSLSSSPTGSARSDSRLTLASRRASSGTVSSISAVSKLATTCPYTNIDTSVNHPTSDYSIVDSRLYATDKSPAVTSKEQSSKKSRKSTSTKKTKKIAPTFRWSSKPTKMQSTFSHHKQSK